MGRLENDGLFDQLSGAAEKCAEIKFGKKPRAAPREPDALRPGVSSGATALATGIVLASPIRWS